ncbi:hypothetical protein Dsin_014651 [Dipteronia sinensis]|uniref:C2H2-type domain-containing protein n=1 Tax=Dipteronia sinensis TaxID=43782 RepID=A0AAE0AME8_9ROSI|nr:hypothetical protein Dsin_014651 [Dipteronia sinensis]
MPVAKLKASNTTEVVKAEEGNESLDTFIKQAIGKEPLLSFSRNGDSSVQWIQLLQALDQQELPGWPLLTPLKVQMQKCDKCSREFCSTINYRRHIRVQHRLKKLDKDSTKNRDLLGAFWDKLSVDETKEIISFKDVTLEEVPGSSIIKSLTTVIRKPGFSSLPQVCLRAGSALLDIFQARPTRFPISSQELFSILDDASEKTFLCGPAVSIQKYIFDGEAGKIGLETRNLVACTSFLVEQILVKAWLADKDAEALRCQKLLVEEEEADQRRQAELLERKRQKKLRQKAKEQRHGEKADDKESSDDTLESLPPPELSSPLAASDSDAQNADEMPDHFTSSLEPFRHANSEEYVDYEVQTGFGNGYSDLGTGQNAERRMLQGNGRRHMIVARRQVLPPKSRGMPNGFHPSQNSQALKLGGGMQKHGINRDSRTAPIVNGNKVWSRKPKPENDSRISQIRVLQEDVCQPEQTKNREVLIGSISVTLGNCNHQEDKSPAEAPYDCQVEHPVAKKVNAPEKEKLKPDSMQSGANRSTVKCWRPVSRQGIKSPAGPVQNGSRESEADVITGQAGDQTLSNESCLRSSAMNDEPGNNSSLMENNSRPGSLQFNIHAAKAFLSERWKEAIASEHVKLFLPPESESPRHPEVQTDYHVTVIQSSDCQKRNVFGNADNRLVNNGGAALESSTGGGAVKAKFRTKPDKGAKIKYIPKQRIPTSSE